MKFIKMNRKKTKQNLGEDLSIMRKGNSLINKQISDIKERAPSTDITSNNIIPGIKSWPQLPGVVLKYMKPAKVRYRY